MKVSVKPWYLLALVCPRVWVLFIQRSIEHVGVLPLEAYYFSELVLIAAAALIVFGTRRPHPVVPRTPPLVMAGFIFVGLLCCDTRFFSIEAVVFLAAAASGMGLAWCYMNCAAFYSRLEESEALVAVMASFALAAVVSYPLSLIPLNVACLVVSPLPILCLWWCRRGMDDAERIGRPHMIAPLAREDCPPKARRETKALAMYAATFFLFGVALGGWRLSVLVSHDDLFWGLADALLNAALPLMVLALLLLVRGRANESQALLGQIGLVLVMLFLAVIAGSGGEGVAPWAAVVSDAVRKMTSALLFGVLVVAACRLPWHPMAVFGLGWSVYPLSTGLTQILAEGLGGDGGVASLPIPTIMFLLVVAVTTLLAVAGFQEVRNARTEGREMAERAADLLPLSPEAELLCRNAGATNREIEVVRYLYRGWSRPYIAEKLLLSENTVRTYAKQAYRKLGVHSKSELIDLLNNA